MLENPVLQRSIKSPLLQLHTAVPENIETLIVRLQTPLRLKQNNKLRRSLPFHLLIRASLRRIAALEDAYGDGEPDIDYPEIVRRAESIETDQSDIRWQELHRYSNRQRKKVSLSGLSGALTYCGDLTAFLPIVRYAEQVKYRQADCFWLRENKC